MNSSSSGAAADAAAAVKRNKRRRDTKRIGPTGGGGGAISAGEGRAALLPAWVASSGPVDSVTAAHWTLVRGGASGGGQAQAQLVEGPETVGLVPTNPIEKELFYRIGKERF